MEPSVFVHTGCWLYELFCWLTQPAGGGGVLGDGAVTGCCCVGAAPCMVTAPTGEGLGSLSLMAGRFTLPIHRGLRQPATSLQ